MMGRVRTRRGKAGGPGLGLRKCVDLYANAIKEPYKLRERESISAIAMSKMKAKSSQSNNPMRTWGLERERKGGEIKASRTQEEGREREEETGSATAEEFLQSF